MRSGSMGLLRDSRLFFLLLTLMVFPLLSYYCWSMSMIAINTPWLMVPHRFLPALDNNVYVAPPVGNRGCRMWNCWDYTRCSITSQFPVYLYDPKDHQFAEGSLDPFLRYSLPNVTKMSPHMIYDPNIACLFIVVIGDSEGVPLSPEALQHKLHSLPHWKGDGRNHLIVTMSRTANSRYLLESVDTGRALVAQSHFLDRDYRPGYDVVLPPNLGISSGDVWNELPALLPARRKYLLTFQGQLDLDKLALSMADQLQRNVLAKDLVRLEQKMLQTLQRIQSQLPYEFRLEFSCKGSKASKSQVDGEWAMCGGETERRTVLLQSTFVLILAPVNTSFVSTVLTQMRLYEAFKHGAIPVMLGPQVEVPFAELLPWRQAVITLPKQRMPELHFILQSIVDADILEYRRRGRLIFETYLGTSQNIVNTMLAVVRTRLNIPAFPVCEEPTRSVFNKSFRPLVEHLPKDGNISKPMDPLPSPRYRRNHTLISYPHFPLPDPFHLYPFTPFSPVLPADIKFAASSQGFHPLHSRAGERIEFQKVLGGNYPWEQFTVVMLTYKRETVLMNALKRMRNLPHLNKILVIWNSPSPPARNLTWPDIGVKVVVVKTSRNSLNNRFLPYDEIETEAVFSIDDDTSVERHEITLGFRVWREARNRIVGIPARHYMWKNQSLFYDYQPNCEISMSLTGGAFFHKYYAYLYSYVMPKAIRDKVDEFMNCEDIAMNFLIAHVTRQPPLKVTPHSNFLCSNCPKSLSLDKSHLTERHKCLNFFVQVYGYMPLLNTQIKADVYTTDKRKCFV